MSRKRVCNAVPYGLVLMAIGLVVAFYPFRFVLEFDADEGVELMKALMMTKGYQLYREIYSDQPPVLTAILAGLIDILGPNVPLARLTILAFSGLLLSSAVAYLQLIWGRWHAVLGLLILLSLPYYLQLSVSVMRGVPAIALAMLSVLLLVTWQRSRRSPYLYASGLALALSLMTKLFTVVLVPVLAIGILGTGLQGRSDRQRWFHSLRPLALWALALGLPALAILAAGGGVDAFQQLVAPHLLAGQTPSLVEKTSLENPFYAREYWSLYLLAAGGAYLSVRRARWSGLYFAGWAGLGALLLPNLIPVWYHHQLLVTVPSAMLAAMAGGEAMQGLRQRGDLPTGRWRRLAGAAMAAVLLAFTIASLAPPATRPMSLALPNLRPRAISERADDYVVLVLLTEATAPGDSIVTDRPMFAFRADLVVPPYLAMFSGKRFQTGELTEADVLQAIRTMEPKAVYLGRFKLAAVETALDTSYTNIYYGWPNRLYIRADAAQ